VTAVKKSVKSLEYPIMSGISVASEFFPAAARFAVDPTNRPHRPAKFRQIPENVNSVATIVNLLFCAYRIV